MNITQSTIKQRENKHKVKQTKLGFLMKRCLLPIGICIFPMAFFSYKCARGKISPPKNVHMSHIKMTIQAVYSLVYLVSKRVHLFLFHYLSVILDPFCILPWIMLCMLLWKLLIVTCHVFVKMSL